MTPLTKEALDSAGWTYAGDEPLTYYRLISQSRNVRVSFFNKEGWKASFESEIYAHTDKLWPMQTLEQLEVFATYVKGLR
jgi:hypothetical protein